MGKTGVRRTATNLSAVKPNLLHAGRRWTTLDRVGRLNYAKANLTPKVGDHFLARCARLQQRFHCIGGDVGAARGLMIGAETGEPTGRQPANHQPVALCQGRFWTLAPLHKTVPVLLACVFSTLRVIPNRSWSTSARWLGRMFAPAGVALTDGNWAAVRAPADPAQSRPHRGRKRKSRF